MSSYSAKQQAYKEDPKAFAEGQYFGASMMPVSGEAIAAYELPGILSLGGEMMQSPNTLRALGGAGLITLGTAAVLPIIGPGARFLKKGLQNIIPDVGPKLATEGGPDTSKLFMDDDGDDLFSLPPASGTYEPGEKKFIKGLNQEIYKLTDKSLFDPAKKAGRKLVIVSCSQKKCPDVGNMKAFDRYTGSVFQSLKKQGVPADVDIAILSAKHGLISRDTPIKKYDLKMSSEIGEKFKSDPTQMNRIINTMTGYDDVIVQGGPLYKDVIRAAAGKGDINLTEVPPGGGIGTQRSDLVKLIKGEDVSKKVSDQDYADQLRDMKINPVFSYQYEPLLNKFDKVLIPGLDRFNLRDILKAGENLKGAEKKRAISDKADEIKFIVNQHLDQAKKDLAYAVPKRDSSSSNSVNRYFQFQVQRLQNQITNSENLMRDLNTIQENTLGNSFDKSKTLAQSQNYKGGVFAKIDTPVYHFSINVGGSARKPAFSKFDKSKLGFYDFGPHVASSPKGAQDRYVSQVGGVRDKDGEIILKSDAEAKGATFPLLADLSKPFNNPRTGKPFTEDELINFKVEKISEILNKPFTRDDLLLENDNFSVDTIRDAVNKISFNLAKDGFTHVPYVNAYEDVGELSYEMLIDRPVNSTKVLQGQFAKKDPSAANDPDFMKAEGGVITMKERAVNMNKNPQGIESFTQYMEKGGLALPNMQQMEPDIGEMLGIAGLYGTDPQPTPVMQEEVPPQRLDVSPIPGVQINPNIQLEGGRVGGQQFMGTLSTPTGSEEMFLKEQMDQLRGRIGMDVTLPSGDQAGLGSQINYAKGTRRFPSELAPFGFPAEERMGSGKVGFGDVDAYYRTPEGFGVSGAFNPNTEAARLNFQAPLQDMGIPQLQEKAVNMFRPLIR